MDMYVCVHMYPYRIYVCMCMHASARKGELCVCARVPKRKVNGGDIIFGQRYLKGDTIHFNSM